MTETGQVRDLTQRGQRLADRLRAQGDREAAEDVQALVAALRDASQPAQGQRVFVGTQEAARILGVSDARGRQLCRAGGLESIRESPRRVSIPLAEVRRRARERGQSC